MNIVSVISFVVALCIGTAAAKTPCQNTTGAMDSTQYYDQRFASVGEAAKAYWSSRMKTSIPEMVTAGPIQSSTISYLVFFVDSTKTHWFGSCTVVEQHGCFAVFGPGGMFFYKPGKSGTFNRSLYSSQGIASYFAGMRPGLKSISMNMIDARITMLDWVWEIKASDGKAYYILVYDTYGTAKIYDAAAWEQLRKDRTVKVDEVVE